MTRAPASLGCSSSPRCSPLRHERITPDIVGRATVHDRSPRPQSRRRLRVSPSGSHISWRNCGYVGNGQGRGRPEVVPPRQTVSRTNHVDGLAQTSPLGRSGHRQDRQPGTCLDLQGIGKCDFPANSSITGESAETRGRDARKDAFLRGCCRPGTSKRGRSSFISDTKSETEVGGPYTQLPTRRKPLLPGTTAGCEDARIVSKDTDDYFTPDRDFV